MKSGTRKAWQLIKPHTLPRLGPLVAVVALGAIASLSATSVVLLIDPLWNDILFPVADAPVADDSGWLDEVGVGDLVASWSDKLAGWAGSDGTGDHRITLLWGLAALGTVIGIVASISEFGFIWLSRWLALRMVTDLRMRLARHLMGLSLRYHGQRHFGDLLSRISSDVTKTLEAVHIGMRDFIRYPADALCYIAIATIAAPRLTLAIVLLIPLTLLPLSKLLRRVRRGSTKSLTTLGTSVQALAQMFQGVRTVKAFRAEERELERFRDLNEGYLRSSMRMVRDIALIGSITTAIGVAGMAGLVAAVGWATLKWDLFSDAPAFLIFFMAIAQANSRLKTLARSATLVGESMGASVRLQELLEEDVDVVESATPTRLSGLGAGIRFEGLSFSYPDTDGPAISGLDLEIRPGETLAVVGPSGAGKSTLTDLLCRFVDPTEGRITVDGVDLREASIDDWTGLYGLVSQSPFLFHDTVEANIRYGRPDASTEEIVEAARAAHLDDFVRGLPRGYDTDVADAGTHLSGGQRQRITIARAILKGAPLLILDEATSSLDSESEASVQKALERLMLGRTVVVVAHRLSTIRDADRIAVLDAGKLVELGTHEELLARDGVYARLAALQGLGRNEPSAPASSPDALTP